MASAFPSVIARLPHQAPGSGDHAPVPLCSTVASGCVRPAARSALPRSLPVVRGLSAAVGLAIFPALTWDARGADWLAQTRCPVPPTFHWQVLGESERRCP